VQFLALAGLTFYVFWSNATQKIKERHAEWYHKVVVDYAVAKLEASFADLQRTLLEAAVRVDTLSRADLTAAREESKKAISQVKRTIFDLRSEMGFRLSAFDSVLEDSFTKHLETLENETMEWFALQPDRNCYDANTSLPAILAKAQVNLLRELMTYEFTNWGLTFPWSVQDQIPASDLQPKMPHILATKQLARKSATSGRV
jgi:hypothetical protein